MSFCFNIYFSCVITDESVNSQLKFKSINSRSCRDIKTNKTYCKYIQQKFC